MLSIHVFRSLSFGSEAGFNGSAVVMSGAAVAVEQTTLPYLNIRQRSAATIRCRLPGSDACVLP